MNDSIKETVIEMRRFADDLVHLTYPVVPLKEEYDILILKQKHIFIDGYYLFFAFSKADYKNHFLETLQIQSIHSPFLPFNLVFFIAKNFYKKQIVAYADFFKDGKKIYCFSSKIVNGKSVKFNKTDDLLEYEDFKFSHLKPDSLKLF